jgi:hypothetical protein
MQNCLCIFFLGNGGHFSSAPSKQFYEFCEPINDVLSSPEIQFSKTGFILHRGIPNGIV